MAKKLTLDELEARIRKSWSYSEIRRLNKIKARREAEMIRERIREGDWDEDEKSDERYGRRNY